VQPAANNCCLTSANRPRAVAQHSNSFLSACVSACNWCVTLSVAAGAMVRSNETAHLLNSIIHRDHVWKRSSAMKKGLCWLLPRFSITCSW
jgi:hypothetical protein